MSTVDAPDPRRTLALLWGSAPERRRPGPKPGLDRERIVRAGIEIADREGVAALTMRRVAAELAVGTASLYTYVPARQELVALMLDSVAGNSSLPHTFPGDWREKFEAWAHEDWAEYHRHPWVLQLTAGRVLPGPNLLAWYDSALRVLADTGLSEPEKVAAIETLDSYLRGLAWSSVEEASAEAAGGLSTETWNAQRASAMASLVDFSRYPALTRMLQAGVLPYGTDTFELGLRHVLDGIARLIDEKASGARPVSSE